MYIKLAAVPIIVIAQTERHRVANLPLRLPSERYLTCPSVNELGYVPYQSLAEQTH